jgi:NifB/MoaA-like Fe-S oxidoreductase
MAVEQDEITLWIGLNESNQVVRVERGDRSQVDFQVLEPVDVHVPFSAVASFRACRPECLFCYIHGGRLRCICRC